MKAAAWVPGVAVLFALAVSAAAPPKVALEIWGLEGGDEVAIDGQAITVKSGGGPRLFTGDPAAGNAPVLHEVAIGRHDVAIKRPGCEPRTFSVSVEGTTKRAVVLDKQTKEQCAVPLAPPRR